MDRAKFIKESGGHYELVLPPPDGNPPQLDINGFSLWHYSSDKQAAAQAIAELAPTNDAAALRDRPPRPTRAARPKSPPPHRSWAASTSRNRCRGPSGNRGSTVLNWGEGSPTSPYAA